MKIEFKDVKKVIKNCLDIATQDGLCDGTAQKTNKQVAYDEIMRCFKEYIRQLKNLNKHDK